jgi:hypothetical protein
MKYRRQIEVQLVKLAGGKRLLRVTDQGSGLSLEKKLDPNTPLMRQMQQTQALFESLQSRCSEGLP